MRTILGILAAAAIITTPALADQSAAIIGQEGEEIGTATFTASPHGVMIRVEIGEDGLPGGWHGIHLHQVGNCSDVGEFKLSGGHINFDDREHGLYNENGPDNGDLPNIHAADDGSASAEMFTHLVMLEGERGLLDEDGSALLIHANEDDQMSQPIGGAGDRIACAALTN